LQARYRDQRFEHGMAVRRSDHVAEAAIAAARALMPSASLRRWSQIPPMSWARASVCSARRMWSFAIPRRVCAFKWLSKNATSKARGNRTGPAPGPDLALLLPPHRPVDVRPGAAGHRRRRPSPARHAASRRRRHRAARGLARHRQAARHRRRPAARRRPRPGQGQRPPRPASSSAWPPPR
jgi:hypothetical protein